MATAVLLALEWYDYRLHRGVARVAARAGWHLTCPSGTPGFTPLPRDWRGQGAITLASDRWLTRLRRRGVMVVDIGLSASTAVPRTVVDNAAAAELAFRHFRTRGWHRLACITQPGVRMFDERATAFAALCAAAGLACPCLTPAELVRRLPALAPSDAAPLALFAVQDSLGAQTLALLRAAGLDVPRQVAVLGADDVDLVCEALPVPLASVDTDQEGLGEAAAERLLRLLAGEPDDGALVRHAPRGITLRASAEALGTAHAGLRAAIALARRQPACGVHAMARAAGLSPQGLDLVCRRELALTPGALLRTERLRLAGEQLVAGASLATAAHAAGIATASSLCAMVKRAHGMTPEAWRIVLSGPRTAATRLYQPTVPAVDHSSSPARACVASSGNSTRVKPKRVKSRIREGKSRPHR